MKKTHLLTKLFFLFSFSAFSQESKLNFELEIQTLGTTNNVVPFWMRSNQHGNIPSEGLSGGIITKAFKEYDKSQKIDWAFGFQGRANAGKNSKLILTEGYGKVKASIFELKAGRTKDVMGLTGDTSLSSGNFSVSGNALGIPKVEISIPEFYTIPIFNKILSFKGSFAHGWVGRTDIHTSLGTDRTSGRPYLSQTDRANTFLHQKSFYGRLGRPEWRLKMYGGFNHQVFWGNERRILGENFQLSGLETMFYVAVGKAYGNQGIARSKIGNHLGSIDIALEYNFNTVKLLLYRQNFYETGGLAKLANIKDGLNGITLENKNQKTPSTFYWKKFLLEFLYTKDQAGKLDSKSTNSGDEDYYNNYIYRHGWAYKGIGLGSPFISSRNDTRSNLINDPKDYFINNRVVALHLGALASIKDIDHLLKLSFSRNSGTFATSKEGRSTGPYRFPPQYGIFREVSQFSAYLEGTKNLHNSIKVGYILAVDNGGLLPNSYGLGIKLSKAF